VLEGSGKDISLGLTEQDEQWSTHPSPHFLKNNQISIKMQISENQKKPKDSTKKNPKK